MKHRANAAGKMALRAFEASDFDELKGWFRNQREVMSWGGPLVRFPLDDAQLLPMLGETLGRAPQRECWSALIGGKLAGHTQAVRESSSAVRLGRIAVAPRLRRQGIAREMLRRIIDRLLADHRISEITLNVYDGNEGARRLYRELGFADCGPADLSGRKDGPGRTRMVLSRAAWRTSAQ